MFSKRKRAAVGQSGNSNPRIGPSGSNEGSVYSDGSENTAQQYKDYQDSKPLPQPASRIGNLFSNPSRSVRRSTRSTKADYEEEAITSGTKSRTSRAKNPTTPGAITEFVPGARYPWPRPCKMFPLRVYLYCETPQPKGTQWWGAKEKANFARENELRREQMRLRTRRDMIYKYEKGDEMDWYDEYAKTGGEWGWTMSRFMPRPEIPFTDEELERW